MRSKYEPILFGLVIGLIAYFLAPAANAAEDAAMRPACHAASAAQHHQRDPATADQNTR